MQDDHAIKELLNAKEGEQIQFKEAKNRFDSSEAARICCALSNCGGGKLVFGISDKRPRQVVGSAAFDQPERTRKGLIEKLKVMVDFQLYEYDEKRVLVFDVASRPLGLPVQADGVAWWYEGDSLIPMPEDVRRKIYEETGVDFSGTVCVGAKLSDIDENAVEVFRKRWIEKSGNTRLKGLEPEQLLRDCEAITEEGITYAALILFGKRSAIRRFLPQAEIVFEYRSSDASGPASQREEFQSGFFSCYDRIWELINLRNDKQHYQDGFFVYDISTFNERVVREAILNAVSHRMYQMSGSIFIRQYRDRLVVESPGGFPNGITVDNILNRQSPRNRRIAEILSLCGLVERSGDPVPESLRPRLKQLSDIGVLDHIGRNKYVLSRELYESVGKSGIHTRKVGLDRNTNRELLLKHIRSSGEKGTQYKELQQVLPNLSRNEIRVLIRELKTDNLVYSKGNTSATRWFAT